jgi:hypothetical protein
MSDDPFIVDMGPKGQCMSLGTVELFRFPSRSRLGTFHHTWRFADGTVECSCEGFQFNKHCRHQDALPVKPDHTARGCPNCRTEMSVRMIDGVAFWHCFKCSHTERGDGD